MGARRFWIVKHGIKASGMPAWSLGGMEDEAIWDLTAFVKVLPTLTAEQYSMQVRASDGHSHSGMVQRPAAEAAVAPKLPALAPKVKPSRVTHDHKTHPH